MEERTVTITLNEYRELISIQERYYTLKAIHAKDTYMSEADKALYVIDENESEG